MNFTTFANSYIFPLFLFMVITGFISYLSDSSIKSGFKIEKFFETIVNDEESYSQLELLTQRDEFIDKLLELSQVKGYLLTALDIEKAISDTTSQHYDNYICLPIGCWKIS